MNKLTIIGNLTRDPELRTTTTGINVCSFTVAVNRRKKEGQEQADADYFNVSAWRERGEICAKYLAKGRKVCVVGPVSVRSFTRNDGSAGASLEVTAEEVEFLSSRSDGDQNDYHSATGASPAGNGRPAPQAAPAPIDSQSGFQQVEMEEDELPF